MADLQGPVLVIGAGLLGTSVALACRNAGLEVFLRDISTENLRTASGLGAGRVHEGQPVQLIVVAVPPDHLGDTIVDALRASDAVVTDVGSVKSQPLAQVTGLSPQDLARYVGSHPMAGSERSGPLAASATLFEGRPWAIAVHEHADRDAVALVSGLVQSCGGVALELSPQEHDQAVARTSHLPHLIASLVAARLVDAPQDHLALSGQGVRDVTRIAAGDPGLWQQIIRANSVAVLGLLDEFQTSLTRLREAIVGGESVALGQQLTEGVLGTRAIPGKHGGTPRPMSSLYVTVPDHPGELARLFADAGEIEVNIEDIRIDHDPGRPVGLVELVVDRNSAEYLALCLAERGWDLHR